MSERTQYFRSWRFDRARGIIEGIRPLSDGRLPRDHCRLITDDDGRLLRLEEHRPDLDLPRVKVLGYASPDSHCIVEALDYNPDGSLRLIHRYHYDGGGRMIDREEFDGEERPRGHVTSRWDEGEEVEEAAYAADGALRARHCYEHDSRGRLVRERIFGPNGTLQGTREIDYDEADNVLEKRWFSPLGQLESRFVHTYDDQGNLLSSRLYGGGGEMRGETCFCYDEVGNLISEKR